MIKLKRLIEHFLSEDFDDWGAQNLPNKIYTFDVLWDKVLENDVDMEFEGAKKWMEEKYNEEIYFLKNLHGKSCWRMMTLSKSENPSNINNIGIFWTPDEKDAQAYNGEPGKDRYSVVYEGVVDLKNIYWPNTLIARLSPQTNHENELQLYKGSKIFIKKAVIEKKQIVEINDYRHI